ncbi:MAG TPA: VOC family protein [Rhodanobacteraceae bacterium]|nr:VOC family protein [Rhodanobacteraceae bacterium]
MKSNRSIPSCAVIPELAYPDVDAAAAWICDALGFSERLRIGSHRIQLAYGGAAIVITEGPAEVDPAHASTHGQLLRVDNVDDVFERARRAGAQVIRLPTDHPFGERQCTIRDLGGHVWTLSQTIADVHPREWGGELVEDAD